MKLSQAPCYIVYRRDNDKLKIIEGVYDINPYTSIEYTSIENDTIHKVYLKDGTILYYRMSCILTNKAEVVKRLMTD